MNGETKHYLKTLGISYCSRQQRWILAGAQKTSTGSRIIGITSVSDTMAVVSEAEKLLGCRLGDEENPVLVSVGADTAQAGFYPFTAPAVDGAKMDALVGAQAEAVIPMPLAQTAYGWRIVQKESAVQQGFLCAVRRSYYQELTALAGGRVGSIMPDATGLVRAWSAMFESVSQLALLVDLRRYHCVLALCEREKLVRAAAADWDGPSSIATLVSDLLNLVDSMQAAAATQFYIAGGTSEAQQLCDALNAAGKTASLWRVSEDKLQAVGLTELTGPAFECPAAAGLALAALDEEPAEYDFIRRPRTQTETYVEWDKKAFIRSLVIAAMVLVLFMIVSYRIAQKESRAIQQALATAHQETTGEKIIARQQMRERIARARPDMQELLTILNTCAGSEVMIDNFSFKKGQAVRIDAKTSSFERVYAFQKKLETSAGISDVKLISPTKDDKKNQVQFKMTFAYRNFSR